MLVKDIMATNPACCTADSGLQEVAKMMVLNDCGCIPVVEDNTHNKLLGVITDRDICCRAVAEGKNPLELTAKDIMTEKVFTVTPRTSVEDCCNLMEEKQVRRIAVIDEKGGCCGMVAQADIAINTDQRKTAEVVQEVSKASASSHSA
ncbi:MAG: CBS domain-containing protein [Pyrinomonadaceae bacterium]|nr:CBS domain-containing protein [Pyrinomonadaceae bacterium]